MSEQASNAPAKSFRCGAIGVSVWRRENQGTVFYSANVSRAYTKDDGATFEYTDSLDAADLPVAASLFNQAFSWITAERAKAK